MNKTKPEHHPYGEFNAMEWVEAFFEIYPDANVDRDTMLAWFANAIMTGYDKARQEPIDWYLDKQYIGVIPRVSPDV